MAGPALAGHLFALSQEDGLLMFYIGLKCVVSSSFYYPGHSWPFNSHLVWILLFLIVLYLYQDALKLSILLNRPKTEGTEGEGVVSSRLQIDH